MLKITKPNSSICGNLLSQYELSTITLHRRTKIQQVTLYIANLWVNLVKSLNMGIKYIFGLCFVMQRCC